MSDASRELAERIGYTFRDSSLLSLALTHGSASSAWGGSNQRLQYLGDAALGLAVSEALYHRLPNGSEGELTKLKGRYVCNSQLAAVARSLRVGPCLRMGKSEEESRGRERERCLADAMEAVIGAVYLDGGMDSVRPIVERFVVAREPVSAHGSKSALQEWLQSRGRDTPSYAVVGETGPPHDRTFRVEAHCGAHTGRGDAHTKKTAEERAAADVLAQLVRSEAGAGHARSSGSGG